MARDVSHFDSLKALLELERAEERARIAADRQSLPLAELVARGRLLLDLESRDQSVGLGGRALLADCERGTEFHLLLPLSG